MHALYICLSLLWLGVSGQNINKEDDGLYHPGKYLGSDGEDGHYVHDNSGQYIADNSGLYKHDESGGYRPDLPGFYRARANLASLSKFKSGGFASGGKAKLGGGFIRPNSQLREFEDDLGGRKPSGKFSSSSSSSAFPEDQFPSSTASPAPKILHKKPLQGINDVEVFRKPFPSQSGGHKSNFFGDRPSGTVFNPKATLAPFRFPPKYPSSRFDESGALIISQNGDVAADGYHWDYETQNGIKAEETGKVANIGSNLEAMRAKGYFTYTGPDNVVYSVMYTADENGFVAKGNHLPTPPPIPEEILKGLSFPRAGPPRGKF